MKFIFLILFLTGCSISPVSKDTYTDIYGYQWYLRYKPIPQSRWIYVEFDGLIHLPRFRCGYACGYRKQNVCVIYLPRNAPKFVKEHEEKHCEGWEHQPRSYSEIKQYIIERK